MLYPDDVRLAVFLLPVLVACGSSTPFAPFEETPDAGGADASIDVTVPFDASTSDAIFGGDTTSACGDGQAMIDGSCATCSGLTVTVQTQASCSISIKPGFAMDGEGFIRVGDAGPPHRVFAIDRWGKGHVIAWCDATTNKDLIGAFDARGYLTQKPTSPRLAAFGYGVLCQPPYLPSDFTYLGANLPTTYQNDAAKLASDYDAIAFCGIGLTWSWDWTQVLVDYVSVHGKGLFLSMDYFGPPGVATATDFQKMNGIAGQAGIEFDPVKLDWAAATLDFKVDCVPDLPPPPR
jgi:hypothetical protein